MLLLFFNSVQSSGGVGPIGSTGYGVLCLESTVLIDELSASVLIGELSMNATIDELTTTVHETSLTSTWDC